MSLEQEITDVILAEELHNVMESSGHSLLRVVAERLIAEKEDEAEKTRQLIFAQELNFMVTVKLIKGMDKSANAYQSILIKLVHTEKAISTGFDYLTIMELEDDEFDKNLQKNHSGGEDEHFKQILLLAASLPGNESIKGIIEDLDRPTFEKVIEGVTPEELAVLKTESMLEAQRNGNLLIDDPSGFLLMGYLKGEYKNSPSNLLKQDQSIRDQAEKDYQTMYLVGAKAGHGPLPKI